MLLRKLSLAAAIAFIPLAATAQQTSNINCKIGPIEKTYGGTKWLVYGCDDKTSIVIVTATGNPAMPFYFLFSQTKEGYQLLGEGTGDKTFTDAAHKDLAALSNSDIAALDAEVSGH